MTCSNMLVSCISESPAEERRERIAKRRAQLTVQAILAATSAKQIRVPHALIPQ